MTDEQIPHTFTVPTSIDAVALYGPSDAFLRLVEESFDATVHARGNVVTVTGAPSEAALVSGCSTSSWRSSAPARG